MRSRTTRQFWKLFDALPADVQAHAVEAYELWSRDHSHPYLRFKKVEDTIPLYSVRIGLHYRAIGKQEGDGATPAGSWPLRRLFYRPDRYARPRCVLPATAMKPADGWCDAPSDPNYNTQVSLPYAASAEQLWRTDRVYDLVVSRYSPAKLEAIMDDFQPDVVGATSVTMTFTSAIRAIEAAKRIDPGVITAMGGAHVSYCAEKTLQKHKGLDVVAMGEGEDMILELCDVAEGKREMGSVKGLVWRDGDTLRNNGAREGWFDVNQLPIPARHLTPLARYRGPKLIVIPGDEDSADALHRQAPDVPSTRIANTSHWPHLDEPAAFDRVLDAFLADANR